MEDRFEKVAVDADYACGTCGGVVIVVWRGRTLVSQVTRLRELAERLLAQHAGRIGFLSVVEPNTPLPEPVAREALAALMKRTAARVAGSALLHEGEGFQAIAVRAVATGLTLIARQPYPHKIFARLPEATAWFERILAGEPDTRVSAAGLERAIAALRAAMG